MNKINDLLPCGRNEPCPCGSGKKYKKCCLPRLLELANQKLQEHRRELLMNHPCVCGSGKKFQDCCSEKFEVISIAPGEAKLKYKDIQSPLPSAQVNPVADG